MAHNGAKMTLIPAGIVFRSHLSARRYKASSWQIMAHNGVKPPTDVPASKRADSLHNERTPHIQATPLISNRATPLIGTTKRSHHEPTRTSQATFAAATA